MSKTASLGADLFIDGKRQVSSCGTRLDVLQPSCGRWLFSISRGEEADVGRAVESSRIAFEDGRWCDLPSSAKKKVLHRFANLVEREAIALDILDAQEMGKPVSLAFANALGASNVLRFHAEALDKLTGDVFTSDKTTFVAQRQVPRGVVGAIVPWNFPTMNAMLKIAPALATGNTVVLKPSEVASRSAVRLAELALEAGLPPGVLNVLPGLGETVGKALALHNDVDMLAFTGSTAIGKQMYQYAGQSNMKTVLAECGGKSPQIVFGDGVDLGAIAEGIAYAILTNQGQWCAAGTRLLVQQDVESSLIEKVIRLFDQVVVGDPLDNTVTYGPLATAQHYQRVQNYVRIGIEEGAECVAGGQPLLPESGGYFLSPVLFRGVKSTMQIAQEEIFGPVLSVMTFKDENEAIRLANSTRYGLAATVWTTQLATGMRLARGIRSGLVTINATVPVGEGSASISVEPYGESGKGTELGLGGMESYLRRQLVWFNHG